MILQFFKTFFKGLGFKIFENHDFQILPGRAVNFNFYEKNITTSKNYLSLARAKSFLKRMLLNSLY